MEQGKLNSAVEEFTVVSTRTAMLLYKGINDLREEVKELKEYVELIKSNQLTGEEVRQIVLKALDKNL